VARRGVARARARRRPPPPRVRSPRRGAGPRDRSGGEAGKRDVHRGVDRCASLRETRADLAARPPGLVAGSIDDQPLPPQRQHALGGEGTLPGYALFRFDCGARRVAFHRGDDVFYPYYGCDRIALFQLEYQNDFPFGHGWGRKLGWDVDLGETPGWVVFFDAGRAWNEREARDGRTDGMDDFAADAGLGLRIGRIGLYWAVPLSGRDQGVNFFIRYGSRL